jgi:S1-C subfamily serine protease
LVVAAGCASSPPRPEFPEPEPAETRPAAVTPRAPGVTRVELDRALDAGPGAFLARVHVHAARDTRGFRGWAIVALDPPYAGCGLQRGDVVTRVNGRVVERPEQFGEVWAALRGAGEIVVDYVRFGEKLELRVPVIDSSQRPPSGGEE